MDSQERSQMKDDFAKLVDIMETKAKYASVFYMDISSLDITKDKDTIDVNTSRERGVKLRCFDGDQFYTYGTSNLDIGHLKKKAKHLASLCVPRDTFELAIDKKKVEKEFRSEPRIDLNKVSTKDKIEKVKALAGRLNSDKRLLNARVIYAEEHEDKIFVDRYKRLGQYISGCFVAMVPFVQTDDGDTRYHYKGFFSPGFETMDISDDQIEKEISRAVSISKAKRIKPGKYTCIFTPDLSGLLAHESFGHGMESDTMYEGRAKASEYLGKRIAPDHVSILENPAYPGKHGSFFFDDEGMITSPTYLVDKGIVKRPITELYSASRAGFPRSGNARAESYDHKSYARMSNTYFAEGKDKVEDMLSKVDSGMYLHYSSGGMEDPKGWGVQIQGIVAEKIKDGKLTGELFYEIGMTGYLPAMLSNILMVGDKVEIPGAGRCGKGHKEWVRVSEGGPFMLVKDVHLS